VAEATAARTALNGATPEGENHPMFVKYADTAEQKERKVRALHGYCCMYSGPQMHEYWVLRTNAGAGQTFTMPLHTAEHVESSTHSRYLNVNSNLRVCDAQLMKSAQFQGMKAGGAPGGIAGVQRFAPYAVPGGQGGNIRNPRLQPHPGYGMGGGANGMGGACAAAVEALLHVLG
jgi:hypothetical protein